MSRSLVVALALLLAGCGGKAVEPQTMRPAAVIVDKSALRDVTLFGVVAMPGEPFVDPRLSAADMVPQLRQFLDDCAGEDCGVKLLGSQTRERLRAGDKVSLALGVGYTAAATLVNPRDAQGKAKLRFRLEGRDAAPFETDVTTPPDQPFFVDKTLADGRRLLLMVGVR